MKNTALFWSDCCVALRDVQTIQDYFCGEDNVYLCSNINDNKLDKVEVAIFLDNAAGSNSASNISQIIKQLLSVVVPGAQIVYVKYNHTEEVDVSQYTQDMRLYGLVDTQQVTNCPIIGKSTVCIQGSKPDYNPGQQQQIVFKPKAKAQDVTQQVVKLDDDEFIDEDSLLEPLDVEPAAAPCVPSATRKPCKNCTCGAAEGKITPLTKDMLENPTSGCGSCGMGDAFRCATCPYRGLPKFKMGEKIQLGSDMMVDDLVG